MTELLTAFMSTFYGYGNPEAKLWFVGMEEGTGPSWEQHIEPRFYAWQIRGGQEFEDLRAYHEAIDVHELFTDTPKIQSTWRRLIQTVLSSQGEDATNTQRIAAYQANELGTHAGDTCLLELMPLPSPSIREWYYAHLAAELPFLASRRTYTPHVRPCRIEGLRGLIAEHKPRHVVFYGRTFKQHWAAITAPHALYALAGQSHILRATGAHTTYWALPHPNARGVSGNPYIRLGELMSKVRMY